MNRILESNQTTSAEVTLGSGVYQVIVASHAGGTWVTEYQPETGEPWIDLDLDFTGDGVQRFVAVHTGRYRVRGGTAGAKAWIVPESASSISLAVVRKVADGS